MKKLKVLIAALLLCLGMTILASCGLYHTHTYAEEWSFDETNHWHAATCKHKEEKNHYQNIPLMVE